MRTRLLIIAAMGITTAAFAAAPARAGNTAVETAIQSRSDLGTFRQTLIRTGVLDELKEDEEYTVFAPTDEAFVQIDQHMYPCFYAPQCKAEVAAIIRNHILTDKYHIKELSKWGGNGIPTMGKRELYVEETYKDSFEVEGHKVLNEAETNGNVVYSIDALITDKDELKPLSEIKASSVDPAPPGANAAAGSK